MFIEDMEESIMIPKHIRNERKMEDLAHDDCSTYVKWILTYIPWSFTYAVMCGRSNTTYNWNIYIYISFLGYQENLKIPKHFDYECGSLFQWVQPSVKILQRLSRRWSSATAYFLPRLDKTTAVAVETFGKCLSTPFQSNLKNMYYLQWKCFHDNVYCLLNTNKYKAEAEFQQLAVRRRNCFSFPCAFVKVSENI